MTDHATKCPWKGQASYYSIKGDFGMLANAVWTYETPKDDVAGIAGYLAYSFAAAFRTEPALTYIRDQLGADYLNIFDLEWQPEGALAPRLAAVDWRSLEQLASANNTVSHLGFDQAGDLQKILLAMEAPRIHLIGIRLHNQHDETIGLLTLLVTPCMLALPEVMRAWSEPLPKEQWTKPSEELLRLGEQVRRMHKRQPHRPITQIFAEVCRRAKGGC